MKVPGSNDRCTPSIANEATAAWQNISRAAFGSFRYGFVAERGFFFIYIVYHIPCGARCLNAEGSETPSPRVLNGFGGQGVRGLPGRGRSSSPGIRSS